jgi:hypothetical protein
VICRPFSSGIVRSWGVYGVVCTGAACLRGVWIVDLVLGVDLTARSLRQSGQITFGLECT